MKNLLLLPLTFLLLNCSAQKVPLTAADLIDSNCPDDGTCAVELMKDKSLNVRTDDLGGIYYQLLDNKGTDVIRYRYTRSVDSTLADAGYREEVIFEISNEYPEMDLQNGDLQATKALFGRFCFCRGATGNYRIQEGQLTIRKKDDGYLIRSQFTITEVPQIIKRFEIKVK